MSYFLRLWKPSTQYWTQMMFLLVLSVCNIRTCGSCAYVSRFHSIQKHVCMCVNVHTKWTSVHSLSGISVLPDTPEILRCRLDLSTSAALSNQESLLMTWLLSDRHSENAPVTKSVTLGSQHWTWAGISKLHGFKLFQWFDVCLICLPGHFSSLSSKSFPCESL